MEQASIKTSRDSPVGNGLQISVWTDVHGSDCIGVMQSGPGGACA